MIHEWKGKLGFLLMKAFVFAAWGKTPRANEMSMTRGSRIGRVEAYDLADPKQIPQTAPRRSVWG